MKIWCGPFRSLDQQLSGESRKNVVHIHLRPDQMLLAGSPISVCLPEDPQRAPPLSSIYWTLCWNCIVPLQPLFSLVAYSSGWVDQLAPHWGGSNTLAEGGTEGDSEEVSPRAVKLGQSYQRWRNVTRPELQLTSLYPLLIYAKSILDTALSASAHPQGSLALPFSLQLHASPCTSHPGFSWHFAHLLFIFSWGFFQKKKKLALVFTHPVVLCVFVFACSLAWLQLLWMEYIKTSTYTQITYLQCSYNKCKPVIC